MTAEVPEGLEVPPEELEPWVSLLDELQAAYDAGGWDAAREFAQEHADLEYIEELPFSELRLPPTDPMSTLPPGVEVDDELIEALRTFDELHPREPAESEVQVPEGMSFRELRDFSDRLRLFLVSEAGTWRSVQDRIARVRELRQLPDFAYPPLVVVDEDRRVVHGLIECWAMESDPDRWFGVAIVVKNAPEHAGRIYRNHLIREDRKEVWSIEDRKDAWENASFELKLDMLENDWIYYRHPIILTCTSSTLDRLGVLIRKQLGAKTKFDPAQLLYVEALREAILKARQKLIREGKTDGDVIPKLERHLRDEQEALEAGAKIESEKGWRWRKDADGYFSHPGLPRYYFAVMEPVSEPEDAARPEVENDPYLIPVSQFQNLAVTHFGLDDVDANTLYHFSSSPEEFNGRLKRYVKEVGEVAPKVRGLPSAEERERQDRRLELWVAPLHPKDYVTTQPAVVPTTASSMDPIYIPSRGRYATISTHKHFQRHGMDNWYYVVEPFDYANYVRALAEEGIPEPERHVLAFDVDAYKTPYDEYASPKGFQYEDEHGWDPDMTTGPGPARNALIDFARERGESNLWMMDDDIQGFGMNAFHIQKAVYARGEVRLNIVEVFELYERLLDKYQNLGTAEMDKQGINMNHTNNFHFAVGTKTYTCIRINTEKPIPWRGRWNDDVLYSLDYLWSGRVNLSSKIISYLTPDTQTQAGGMTEAFKDQGVKEQGEEAAADKTKKVGTLAKAQLPMKLFPSVASTTFKYSRDHHQINYAKIQTELLLGEAANLDDLVLPS